MKLRHKVSLTFVLLLTQWLWAVQFANANVVYTYTGNDFQFVGAPYSTSDNVTASITLLTALGDNFDNFSSSTVGPVSFTMSDDVVTITKATASSWSFFFETGPSGKILYWDITAETDSGATFIGSASTPFGSEDNGYTNGGLGGGGNGYDDPGIWMTPLPATLPLFATGLGAFGLFGWRTRRKAQGVA
jgi:hypothetical protein